jgi:hypothetical protein
MWHSTLKHISMIKNPDINFDTKITMDREGVRLMNLQRHIFFGPPGENPPNIVYIGALTQQNIQAASATAVSPSPIHVSEKPLVITDSRNFNHRRICQVL